MPHDPIAIYANTWRTFYAPRSLIDLDLRITEHVPTRLIGIEIYPPGIGYNFPAHPSSCISDVQDSRNVPLVVRKCTHKWRKFARDLILNGVLLSPSSKFLRTPCAFNIKTFVNFTSVEEQEAHL